MDADILDIRLLPAWSPSSVRQELASALQRADLLQGAVAYWTIGGGMFGDVLAASLRHRDAFMCVDLHLPTDVDALAALTRDGGHVRWYFEEIATYYGYERKEPPYLVHSKMLLFWLPDRMAELWVGSHNWTNRAIAGLNVESSLVVRMRRSSRLFDEAADYLAKIASISQEFDPSEVETYRDAQTRAPMADASAVIELEAGDAGRLDRGTIRLFGTDPADQKQLRTVGEDLWLVVVDSQSEQEFVYPTTILHSGFMPAANPAAGGISFGDERYAFRRRRRFPVLLPKGPLDPAVSAEAHYFVTLELGPRDDTLQAKGPPEEFEAWVEVDESASPILQRLDEESRLLLFGRRRPRPMKLRFAPERDSAPGVRSALTLADRRNQVERPLVTRRVLRRRRT